MSSDAQTILANLQRVSDERLRRRSVPGLVARVKALKAYQHGRFARCYADLLSDARYTRAARFFLDDLYGPHDFTDRDAQFARVVPALVRLFPSSVIRTVRTLSELHALSETLDTSMAENLDGNWIDQPAYARAWTLAGSRGGRSRQIAAMHEIGLSLERLNRNPLLRHSLRMMRGPARAAGLSALQTFLENGFDAFRSMRGAGVFLDLIRQRETALAAMLFDGDDGANLFPHLCGNSTWPEPVDVATMGG